MPQANLITNLVVEEISLVPLGANNKTFIIRKGDENIGNLWFLKKEKLIMTDPKNEPNKSAPIVKSADVERLEKELADQKEKFEKEQKEQKEKLEKENKALLEKLGTTEAIAKAALEHAEIEKNARVEKEFISVAKENYPFLGDANKMGIVLKAVSEKLTKEQSEYITEILKSANEKISKSPLLKEFGSNTDPVADDVYSRINKMAKEYSNTNKVSFADALTKVLSENSSLYDEYIKGR